MCIAIIRAVYQQKGRHDHIAPASLFSMVVLGARRLTFRCWNRFLLRQSALEER
jgi:uncharacterized ion transporter superfamily protein YfcC